MKITMCDEEAMSISTPRPVSRADRELSEEALAAKSSASEHGSFASATRDEGEAIRACGHSSFAPDSCKPAARANPMKPALRQAADCSSPQEGRECIQAHVRGPGFIVCRSASCSSGVVQRGSRR